MQRVELEYGRTTIGVRLPDSAVVRSLPDVPPLVEPRGAILAALERPMNSLPLAALVRQRRKAAGPECSAVIVVSDNTRPVPYRGEQSLLLPLVEILRREQISRIRILVAAGTHRRLSPVELETFLPVSLLEGSVEILQHDGRDPASLRCIGRTRRGTDVWINAVYLDAHVKILTGLVEPHFMAGVSGGAKSICPGIVGEPVTQVFHGAAMMTDPACCSFRLAGNPCFEEAREVAALAGCDFILNATLNRHKQLTAVYAGELIAAHTASCERVLAESGLVLPSEFDGVLTHAGFVGVNHYQAGKAAVEGARAVKAGGTLILFGRHTDPDPVGSDRYKHVLAQLKRLGADGLDARLLSADWTFVPEQWQPQMWGRVLRKLGPGGHLVYCVPQVSGAIFTTAHLPGEDGSVGVPPVPDEREWTEQMVQAAVDRIPSGRSLLVLADGPYGVPLISAEGEKQGP